MKPSTRWLPVGNALLLLLLTGCSVRRMAINTLADTFAASGEVYTSDDDPELVRDALPFALKTLDTLLAQAPDHAGLQLTACRTYTQYAFAFVELEAARLEAVDYRASRRQRDRALRLYLRARGHCFAALDLAAPGTSDRLPREPEAAVAGFGAEAVPLLYWTAASWGAAIAAGLDQPELVVDLPAVRALLERALELRPDWNRGTLHETMIALEARPESMGGSPERARHHFERALGLNGGHRPGPYLTWARQVSYREQNREEFERLLDQALAIDPERLPGERLQTLVTQERARLLRAQADELFLDDGDVDETETPNHPPEEP